MRRISIHLEDRHVRELDRRARAKGTSRGAVLQDALDSAFAIADGVVGRDLDAIERAWGRWGADVEPVRRDDSRQAYLEQLRRG